MKGQLKNIFHCSTYTICECYYSSTDLNIKVTFAFLIKFMDWCVYIEFCILKKTLFGKFVLSPIV